MRERVAECRCCLHWRKCELSNVIRLVKSENAFDLIEVNMLLHSNYVGIQVLDVFYIRKDESLLGIKTKSDNVLDIVNTHRHGALGTF